MSLDYRQYQLNADGSPATVVEPDTYLTPQQEKDQKYTGVNELGSVLSTLGTLGMAGLAYGAAKGFGGNRMKQRGGKGLGKSKRGATGIPQSQFSPKGLSNKRLSVGSPTEKVAQIGLTRSAATPYGPVKKFSPDPIQQLAKGIGQVAKSGRAAAARAGQAIGGVGKRVKAAYGKLTKDPFASTNVFEGKGPNEMRGKGSVGPSKPPKINTNLRKGKATAKGFKPMATIAENGTPTTPRSAYKTPLSSTPASAKRLSVKKATASQGNLLRIPTPFTRAGY